MKVAIVVNELDIRGGTHKQVLRLCEYLEKSGIELKLITKYYDPEKTYPDFERYRPISLFSSEEEYHQKRNLFQKICSNIQFYRFISKDYNIVNIHDNGLHWTTYLATRRPNMKTVWQINDLPSCFGVGVGSGKTVTRKDKICRRLYRYLAARVDAITVNVTKNKERVETCMGKNATVLYCGVDTNPELCKHSFGPAIKSEIRILSTGVFFPYRNYETLVCVIEKLCMEGYRARLDIIGSTDRCKEYADSVINLVHAKDMGEHIKVWGQVDENTYNTLYNSADVFAFVNIDQSWGLTVFEAMSAGIPTIVSNSVGAIELLHDGEDAIIVEPKDVIAISDAIKKLASDEAYYNKISDNAYIAVKEYSWEKLYSSKLVGMFRELMNHD